MMQPSSVRNCFFSILSDTENNIDSFVMNPGSDMTRHRDCPFQDTVLATMCFAMNRTNTELFQFFSSQNARIPTKSALVQQRKKLAPALFPHLLKTFNEAIPFKKTFKGLHIVAADGTDINLPTDKNDTLYRIQQARSEHYYYQMHLNLLYDICENRYVSAYVQPRPQMNEAQALISMIEEKSWPDNTLIIADRGYASFNMLAHLLHSNIHFLIRARSPQASGGGLKYLMNEDIESDRMITVGITRSRSKKFRKHPESFKFIRKNRVFDFLAENDKSSVYYMTFRATCIRLDNGTYEYLISNLPMDRFSTADLKALYWKRWPVETSFRSLKYALSMVYMHSVNRELIIQEIYAKLILYNFSSLLHTYAEASQELKRRNYRTKHVYRVSFDDVIPVARELLKHKMKNGMIKALLLRHLTALSPDKKNPRHMRSQVVKPLNNRA